MHDGLPDSYGKGTCLCFLFMEKMFLMSLFLIFQFIIHFRAKQKLTSVSP